ncbi:MAG: protein kinase [Rubripirellula sp.]
MHGNQELQRFLEDSLSEHDASSIEAWLDQDPSRWKRIEELADDPALVAKLRDSLPAVMYQGEPEFQRVMAEASTAARSEPPTVSQHLAAGEKPEPDDVSLDGYRVIRQLGSGGMGAVYEAEHELMQKRVAIKVMSPRFLQDVNAAERFMSEMVAIGKLNHLNLVRGLDARRQDGRLYLIMEYLEAEDLAAYRAKRGPLPMHLTCDIVRQAALGLAHAHDQGIIHRDIKPLNLMVTDEGVVKVLDLGLARLENTQATTHLTSDRTIVGTPDYLSPEQVQTPRDVDARADIYSLGCTLFFLLTGRSPFHQHKDAMSKLMAHVNESPSLPADTRERLPDALAKILSKLVEKDRSLRFQTAREVAEALTPFCEPLTERQSSQRDSGQPSDVENKTLAATQAQNVPEFQHAAASKSERQRPSKQWPIALSVSVALMLVAAFGVTLLIKAQDGTIELQFANSSLLAKIDVDKNHTVTIRDPNDKTPITIAVDRKNGMLRLRKKGFEVLTKDFQLDVKGQKIQVSFIPLVPATEESDAVDSVNRNRVAISHGGGWQIDRDEIVQTEKKVPGQMLRFGDMAWSEYDFSFEGRVPKQTRVHGFSGMFHLQSPIDYIAFGIGIYYNRGHEVSRLVGGKWHRAKGMYAQGAIEPDKWHKVRIQVRGQTTHCYLNERLLFVSNEPLLESGQCGLATYDTRARFRNLRVESPDGAVLWSGLPTSIKNADSRETIKGKLDGS